MIITTTISIKGVLIVAWTLYHNLTNSLMALVSCSFPLIPNKTTNLKPKKMREWGRNRRDREKCIFILLSFHLWWRCNQPLPRRKNKGPTQFIYLIIRPWVFKSSLLKSRIFHNCFCYSCQTRPRFLSHLPPFHRRRINLLGSLSREWPHAAAKVRWK